MTRFLTFRSVCVMLLGTFILSMGTIAPAHAFLDGMKKDGATGGQKFAVVNVARLMADSKAGKALNAELQSELKALKAENDEKETALVKENDQISAQVRSLSSSEAKALREKFAAKVNKLKEEAQAKRKDIDERSSKALITLRDSILKILKKVSDEKGYSAVFAQQSVVLLDGGINLTDEVLKQLNKDLPTLSMK